MSEFMDKVVLVTGAGRGLGRAIAEAFAAQGAIVAVNDLTPINLDKTVAGINASGGRVKAYLADIAKRLPVEGLIHEIAADWGRLDVVVNNAGVRPRASILEMDEWDWCRTIEVNLNGPFFITQAAGRVMRAQGGGVIINIGNAGDDLPGKQAAYLASKAGLSNLTRTAARELAADNIRVNAVCPGLLETESTAEIYPDAAARDRLASTISQKRLGNPQDVTGLVLFLCSQAAAYINGQVIMVDGGGSVSLRPHRS
jgi:NAD(P)-dependent dehydrogenase (short-subunit alcohol dehydrogenase family)